MYYNKRKMLVSIMWVILGASLIILDIMGIIDNPIFSGMGGGWLAVGIMQIYKNLKYHSNEEYKEKIDIEYLCSVKSDFLSELKANRKEDILKGATSVGPHRDDMVFLINGKRAKEFSSQGQKRSIALTLKLASAQILKEITGEQPVALLDDVMSELDKTRQDYILNHISDWQVFLTCCEKAHFENLAKGKIFSVKNGEIT